MRNSSRLCWHKFVSKIDPSCVHFFPKSDNIRHEIKPFVAPPFPCGTSSGLNFIHDHYHLIFFRDSSQFLKEEFWCMVIPSFGLNCFNYASCNFHFISFYYLFCLVNASYVLLMIVICILFKRVFVYWERGGWPVKLRNIYFMNWFRMSNR